MRARRYGRIVNISSIAGIGTALPGNAFYAATKAEVAILTKRFAMELGPHNVTVNAVAPGFVRTEMTQRGRGAGDWQGTEERFAAKAMMGRIGEPEDVADAVVFLASPESRLDHGTGVDRRRRANGLHRTRLKMSSAFLSCGFCGIEGPPTSARLWRAPASCRHRRSTRFKPVTIDVWPRANALDMTA